MEFIYIYLLIGIAAGFLAGLLGIGGGLVVVPALVLVFKELFSDNEKLMHMAVATSLATIIFTSLSSIYTHNRHGAIRWPVFYYMLPGIILGTCLGVWTADYMEDRILLIAYVFFLILVSIQMFFDYRPDPGRKLPAWPGMTGSASFIGFFSSFLGIGGGTLTTPFLYWCNVPIRNAIALSATCGLPIAIVACIGYFFAGINESGLIQPSTGYVYWPAFVGIVFTSILFAPIGARLTYILPVQLLKKLFSLILLVIGLHLVTNL